MRRTTHRHAPLSYDRLASQQHPSFLLIILALFLVLSACDPFHTGFDPVEEAVSYQAAELTEAPSSVDALRVMTWNIKFAGGRVDFFFDCFGDAVLMEEAQVLEHLEGLAAKINQYDPDLLLLQEVDINAKRSAFVDQAQWLLDHTSLNYGVYASQWRADYVPSDGIGAVDSGNLILSRWPIEEAERIALPLIEEQSAITRYFYLRRNALRARIDLPGAQDLWAINIHADAYGSDGTRQRHIDRFETLLDELEQAGQWVLGGGDLNTLPPGTEWVSAFPDSVCESEDLRVDDYSMELDALEDLYARYAPAIPLVDYQADNTRYTSHTTDRNGWWNRKLDYLFSSSSWETNSGLVHQSEALGGMATMPLSDHAPVTGTLEYPP